MARIRTIKPDFFRHEGLQDLAAKHGCHVMLVFAGLWGHCDKAGRFKYLPRQLKLDILPFLDFDMAKVLSILEKANFIEVYEIDGKQYAQIPSFALHQRFSGKESKEPNKYPEPPVKQQGSICEVDGKQQGSVSEAPGKHVGTQEGNMEYGIREWSMDTREGLRASQTEPQPIEITVSKKKTSKVSAWPSEAVVPEDWLDAGESERQRHGLPAIDLRLAASRFQHFWASSGKTKKDWRRTWLNWILNEKSGSNFNGKSNTIADSVREILDIGIAHEAAKNMQRE